MIADLELRKLTTTYGGEHVEQRHPRVQLVNVASNSMVCRENGAPYGSRTRLYNVKGCRPNR